MTLNEHLRTKPLAAAVLTIILSIIGMNVQAYYNESARVEVKWEKRIEVLETETVSKSFLKENYATKRYVNDEIKPVLIKLATIESAVSNTNAGIEAIKTTQSTILEHILSNKKAQ